ncbi:keratin, type I cytoskeletal 13-like [Salvelinus sp. IW2-2015]|uniref:keratin, type I cytoskeletal 13-like n=1 Tax=Salvelinus sp. IW2-2015 TaxID=2691554 RepID=UPI0038D4A131
MEGLRKVLDKLHFSKDQTVSIKGLMEHLASLKKKHESEVLSKEVMTSTDILQSSSTEIRDVKSTLQALQIGLQTLLSMVGY